MGKKKDLKTTPKKEPQPAAVSSNQPKIPSFQTALIDMSWRIALPFMAITLGGIKLDEMLETEPALSITGVLLAAFVVGLIVYRFVNTNFPGTFGGDK